MEIYSRYIKRLTSELMSLPGVGAKNAQRLAFYILNQPKENVQSLVDAITEARDNIHYCKECMCLTDEEICSNGYCPNLCRFHKRPQHNYGS